MLTTSSFCATSTARDGDVIPNITIPDMHARVRNCDFFMGFFWFRLNHLQDIVWAGIIRSGSGGSSILPEARVRKHHIRPIIPILRIFPILLFHLITSSIRVLRAIRGYLLFNSSFTIPHIPQGVCHPDLKESGFSQVSICRRIISIPKNPHEIITPSTLDEVPASLDDRFTASV